MVKCVYIIGYLLYWKENCTMRLRFFIFINKQTTFTLSINCLCQLDLAQLIENCVT